MYISQYPAVIKSSPLLIPDFDGDVVVTLELDVKIVHIGVYHPIGISILITMMTLNACQTITSAKI